jgi:membrane associated rhomboid family serine protease
MSETITTCYRHPDRRAGVKCQRCGNPICPTCMVQASVGFHCPDCARGSRQQVYNTRTIRRLNQPVVTYTLIAINVVVFIAQQWVVVAGQSLTDLGLVVAGYRGPNGALEGVAGGEWWRIITSGFLHESVLHLGLNMLCLYLIGAQLEVAMGKWRYLALYFTSLLAGSLLVLIVTPFEGALGASGAIFGLFGVAFVYQRSLGINPWRSGIGGLIIFTLIFSFAVPGISWAGHIGGLVGGAAAALGMFAVERRVKSPSVGIALCAAISVALFVGCIVAANQAVFG